MKNKNIWLLPTKKMSRLYLRNGVLKMDNSGFNLQLPYQNIYITSDEEIKEDDVVYSKRGFIGKFGKFENSYIDECKKIILTTDQDLIKDGVQAIPDEFLEWFVNNSSCEYVEVEIETTSIQLPQQQLSENSYDLAFRWINKKVYKIIIPQEEPKQETLEEASSEYVDSIKNKIDSYCYCDTQEGFQQGAKWQAERMYSEEDIMNALHSVELKNNKDYSKIYNSMKEFLNNLKRNRLWKIH
jgi:hypothetical protein